MSSGESSQRELYPYNAFDAGLFGLHHDESDLRNLGLDPARFSETRKRFILLCDKLGSRALSRMDPRNAIITPEPVQMDLAEYMMKILGYTELPMLADVNAPGQGELCARILSDCQLMDELKKWVESCGSNIPVLTPRTYTMGSVVLAIELGIYHSHNFPRYLPDGSFSPLIYGIYPTLGYIEQHPAWKNNSKVGNYLMQSEIDYEQGINYNPEGGVAFGLKTAADICGRLAGKGKQVIIKADLSVDGIGNLHIDLNREEYEGVKLSNLEIDKLEECIALKLKERGIPLGPGAGVVVTEFLADKIADPSFDVYCPPKEWGLLPFVQYTCSMIIEKGGFAGSVLPDQMIGIPKDLRLEYTALMNLVEKSILTFCTRRWDDGYVGICDCDVAVCLDPSGHLYIKILEYNYNRENGGTATNNIFQRLGCGQGVVIARDSIEGPGLAYPFPELLERINSVSYNNRRRAGVVVLGHKLDQGMGDVMSLVYAQTYREALEYDQMLRDIAN